jgi:hypothetical protein
MFRQYYLASPQDLGVDVTLPSAIVIAAFAFAGNDHEICDQLGYRDFIGAGASHYIGDQL